MATRRWFGDLAKWMRQEGMSKEEVAKQSGHKAAHVLALFADPSPNPSLRLYLDLLDAAGARFAGVDENTPRALVERLAAVMEEREISTSKLARLADVNRPQLSTLLNDTDPNPKLVVIDRIVEALGIEDDFEIVSAEVGEDAEEADDDDDDADDAEADDDDGDEADDDDDDADDADEDNNDGDDEYEDDEGDEADEDDNDNGEDDDEADEGDEADDEADEAEDEAEDEGDEGDEDDEDDEGDEGDEADEDDEDDNDQGIAAEQADQIRALQQQNAALQRQVQQNEAELREIKGKKPWWRTALEVVTGVAAVGGAAYLVTRPPPDKK